MLHDSCFMLHKSMLKPKRKLRREGDDTQTPGTPAPPQPPPSNGGNPFTKWLVGLGVVMLVIVGTPVLMWAKTGAQATGSADLKNKVLVDATALKKINENLKDLQAAMDDLVGSQLDAKDYMGQVISGLGQDGRASCLNDCRQTLTACQEKSGEDLLATSTQGLHPCLSKANECITKCNNVPRPPISCEDRCSVALGGCTERLAKMDKPNPKYVAMCQKDNVNCLVNACKLGDQSNLPENYCADQCARIVNVCLAGLSSYDKDGQAKCAKVGDTCENQICKPAEKPAPPVPELKEPVSTSTGQVLEGENATGTPPQPKPAAGKKKPVEVMPTSTATQ